MWLYLIIFFIPVLFYYNGSAIRQKQTTFLACFLFFLAVFVGVSDMLGGYDRYIYGEVFDSIADITTKEKSYLYNGMFNFFPNEYGYIILNIIISFFTANRYIFILLYTLLFYYLFYKVIKRYTDNYPLALILFFGLWFYFSFTYLRQVMGAVLAWVSIKYIIDRKFWKFLIVFLIAVSFHKSAIIFFPLYFVPLKKYSKQVVLFIMLGLFIIGLSPLPNMLFNAYGDISAVELRADYNASGGLRIAYIVEAISFLYIILTNYDKVGNSKKDFVLLNSALLFCVILFVFMRSENGGRLSWYYMVGVIATLTNILSHSHKKTILPSFMIVVSLFLYVRIYVSWQEYYFLYPYKTFFTNGCREEDNLRDYYEYDYRYDKDKLYRTPFRFTPNIRL